MEQIPVKKILTHQNPDLDAILSVLLLKKYGKEKFPGVEEAEVIFSSANSLPENKTTAELEKEGVLAVDIGGGRFDTHPVENQTDADKLEHSAADLVAEYLGVLEKEGWKDIIEYVRQHDVEGRNVQSTDYIHQLPTIMTILSGLKIIHKDHPDFDQVIIEEGSKILDELSQGVIKRSAEEWKKIPNLSDFADRYLEDKDVNQENPPDEYRSFIEWNNRLRDKPEKAYPKKHLDRVMSFKSLFPGVYFTASKETEKITQRLIKYFDAIIEREKEWYRSLEEFDNKGELRKIGEKVIIAIIASENGLAFKAARFRGKADLIVYRDPSSGATTFQIKRNGPLRRLNMKNLAAKVRIAECIEKDGKPDYKNLHKQGIVNGWFLHQSDNLLICGSKKATEFEPSKIALSDLADIAASEINWEMKLPTKYCPDDRCIGRDCLYYQKQFPTCKNHRNRTKAPEPEQAPKKSQHLRESDIEKLLAMKKKLEGEEKKK